MRETVGRGSLENTHNRAFRRGGAGDQKLLYFKCDEKTWGSLRTTAPHCCLHNSRGIRVIISTFQLRNLEPNNVW